MPRQSPFQVTLTADERQILEGTAPRFDDNGAVLQPGRVTVLQNGVLIQDNAEIKGPTSGPANPKYKPHPLKQSLALQDHGNPIRYRNIWIREL